MRCWHAEAVAVIAERSSKYFCEKMISLNGLIVQTINMAIFKNGTTRCH